VDRAVSPDSRLVAIALGSNLGDRRAAIEFALRRLSLILSDFTFSEVVETDPEGPSGEVLDDQPLYLNAVATGSTTLEPRVLLEALLEIEREYGRERPYAGAARTLDLDLILIGDIIVNDRDLQVPHPRFRSRFFVLGPLTEIAPDMRDPVTGLRAGELLQRLLRDETR
jgi:2-amino-4-hydroxy-6-hydroxymethyldihydropteridine diphosphokinase